MSKLTDPVGAEAPIRIMFVDDEALTRFGFRQLLSAYAPRIEVVAEARSAGEALTLIAANQVDVALTDLRMQGNSHSGIELIATLRERMPNLPVIALTAQSDEELLLRVWDAGAAGFVSKEGEPGEILRAIEAVHGGATHFPAALQQALRRRDQQPALTERECIVCDLIATDMSSKEIARVLAIDARTVDTHRGNVARKLNMNGKQLHSYCIERLRKRLPKLTAMDEAAKRVAVLAQQGYGTAQIAKLLRLAAEKVEALRVDSTHK